MLYGRIKGRSDKWKLIIVLEEMIEIIGYDECMRLIGLFLEKNFFFES